MTALVRVTNVSKTFVLAEAGQSSVSLREALRLGQRQMNYREVRALDGISLDVREGERVGIIGRNGAGKTTLLSIIAGIAAPSTGRVEVQGDLHAMLTIGAVLRDEASGRENIYIDGAVHGKSRTEIDAVVEEIIAFTELGEFIDRPVRTYSSGMKGRLAFAMGAFIDPDVLIIDETLSVGDAFFAGKATRKMQEVAAKGRIVILVSHGLNSIVEMCNRCLWLDQGRIVMDGDPKAVTDAYQKAVEQADETSLAAKFEAGEEEARRPELGALNGVVLSQDGRRVTATARAFAGLTIRVEGILHRPAADLDLLLRIVRVDGRLLWHERASAHGARLPETGTFAVTVAFDPLLLGENLYRLDALIVAGGEVVDRSSTVFEVIDEDGQYGGTPLLFYPPQIGSSAMKDI